MYCVDLGESFYTSVHCYYSLARIGFDTAENEFVAVHIVLVKLPVAILTHPQFRVKCYYSQSSFRTPPVPSVYEDNPVYRRRRRRERAPQSQILVVR